MFEERRYKFTLTGSKSLLMHRDDVMAADELAEVRANMRKGERVAGDDRSPAWTWLTYLYHDGESHLAMDAANVMAALCYGGGKVPVGRGAKTFKEQSQSGIALDPEYLEFRVPLKGKMVQVPHEPLVKMRTIKDFREHYEGVKAFGFRLHVKRATVGQSKHVRVRPMFPPGWQVSGTAIVTDDMITDEILERIFTAAGRGGLCDWRPSSKKPGQFGMFTVELRKE